MYQQKPFHGLHIAFFLVIILTQDKDTKAHGWIFTAACILKGIVYFLGHTDMVIDWDAKSLQMND